MSNIENRLELIEKLLLNQKNVLTFDEACVYTGLSKSYLYKLTSQNKIPCYRPNGKMLYFNKQELDNWMLRNRNTTSEEINDEVYKHTK